MKKRFKKIYIGTVTFIFKVGTRTLGRRGLHKVWPFGNIYDWVSDTLRGYDDWPETIEVDGHNVYAPRVLRPGLIMWHGRPGELDFRLFMREIPKGGVVVDVGANIGHYTLAFARAAGKSGRVFAFEPEPENLGYLRKNIEANHYSNVTIVPSAVGETKGRAKLFISKFRPGGHQLYDIVGTIRAKLGKGGVLSDAEKKILYEHEKEMAAPLEVDVISLDDYFRGFDRPIDLVKIDVEGAEGGVVAGMKDVIRKNPSLKLHFEFWPAGMGVFGTDPSAHLKSLEALGFRLYDLENFNRAKDRMEQVGAHELISRCSGDRSTDVWAVRK